ncbi:MAG: hypothetical protein ACQES1_02405 [Bacteroidota bacterium]
MLSCIRNTYFKIGVILIASLILSYACKNESEKTEESLSEYDILMHFLQDKAYYSDSCKRYMFICGPQCKGCTTGMLYRLDSLSRNNQTIREMQFITSHNFVGDIALENIDFTYDESWENVNIDFYNMRWYALSDTAIISKAKLTADNGDAFVRTVKE